MTLSIICALTENNAIGNKGGLLYYLPADLRHFKELTTGHTIIMGRKTFDSLPKGALPNRRNIIISRNTDFTASNAEVYHSLNKALAACQSDTEVFIIGGESVYRIALPMASRLCLTHIHATPNEADTFFPEWNACEWTLESSEEHQPDEKNRLPYTFANYIRK